MNHQAATNTDFSTTTFDDVLNERGILATAQKAHWQPQGNCWKYPIYDLSGTILTYRYKAQPKTLDTAANSNTKPKYWWSGEKPENCHYYLLPGLQEAITQYNGLLYIASGEPDVLAFKSAGIDNVLCWFGETSVPPDLAAFLRGIGVQYVIVYPDRDRTGSKAAEKIAAALYQSGIQLHAAALPDYLGDKGDINKLWQHVDFDRDAFRAALVNDTRRLEIEPSKPKPQKRKPKYPDNDQRSFYAAIEQALGIDGYKGNGWSKKAAPCPFHVHEHDDTRPAAYWHRDKHILKCFKCQEHYLAKDVAAALGLDWKDFSAGPDHLPRPSLDAPIALDTLYHFPWGIPDRLRHTLLSLHCQTSIKDHAPALIVLELRQQAIAAQQLTPEQPLTASWLIDYATRIDWYTGGGVIRRGLKQLEALGFLHVRQAEADGKGRPTDHYHPQPLTEALLRLQAVMGYRIRERIFGDKIPDTVTPDWLSEYPPEVARRLVELENRQRQDLYEEYDEARRIAEQHYQREVGKMRRLLSLERLLTAPSTVLGDDLLCTDGQGYRALLYRSLIVAAGQEGRHITRAQAAAQLGVSDKTLSMLRLKAGIATDEQFETMAITDPVDVLEQVHAQFPWAARRDFGKFLDNGQGRRKGLASRPEDIDRWAQYELDNHHTIVVHIQTASRERLATEDEQDTQSQIYAERRARQRRRCQSRPPSPGDQAPSLLEEILAQAVEDACPPTFSMVYKLRQMAILPYKNEVELLAILDLFSNLPPLRAMDISRGGKHEKKWGSGGVLSAPERCFQQQWE